MSRYAVRLGSLVLGAFLFVTPSADAGVIPWVYNSIFGYGPMYGGYGPAYPTHTAGYAPAAYGYSPYATWGTGYSLGYAPNFSAGFASPYSVGYTPYSTYYGGSLDGCGCNPCGCSNCGSLGCSNCSNGDCSTNYGPANTDGVDPTPADKDKDLPKDDFEGKDRPYTTIPKKAPDAPAWSGSNPSGTAGDTSGAAGVGETLGTPGNFSTPKPAPGEPGGIESTIPKIDRPGLPGLGNPVPPATGTPGLNESRVNTLGPRIAGSRFELQRERVTLRTEFDRPVVARGSVTPERTSPPVFASK